MNFLFSRPKKVALVLGGGGARGLAHVGLLKVFDPLLFVLLDAVELDVIRNSDVFANLFGDSFALFPGTSMNHGKEIIMPALQRGAAGWGGDAPLVAVAHFSVRGGLFARRLHHIRWDIPASHCVSGESTLAVVD